MGHSPEKQTHRGGQGREAEEDLRRLEKKWSNTHRRKKKAARGKVSAEWMKDCGSHVDFVEGHGEGQEWTHEGKPLGVTFSKVQKFKFQD